ncbi:hypothetical protein [Tolypothrix sp. VBCCA 56010]|uniref:hypothetical protein n=1 Tax=Tolypothrix sp. VBCCA 56010 TaxID=3137731 RepID=UPI003D7C4652
MGNGHRAMGNGNKKKLDVFHKGRLPTWTMPDAPCPMPHARCPMPHAQCPMPNALCPLPHAPFPI